jgi:glycosyltransferase involved in cell wall biosynthesis
MNILFLTTHLNTGGITSYLVTLAKGLRKKGHGVFIASSGGDMVETFLGRGVVHLCLNIRTKSELDPKIYLALGPLSRFIKKNSIDVIHSQTRVTQVMGCFLSKMTGRPFISTCHGFFRPRIFRRMFPCWGKMVIAISPQVAEHLRKDFGVPQKNIVLISNGIDVEDFPLISAQEKMRRRERLNLPPGPVIGIIARLSDVKGHDVLLDAMPLVLKKIVNARLLIVGEGKMEEEIKKKIAAFGLSQNVFLYPTVNRTSEFLAMFDIFVMPSLQEGLGLSVMEAQAAALPVVASRVGGIPSLIEHGRTGLLVEPRDSAGLASALIQLLGNPPWAGQMGLRAREFIEHKFSAREMVEKTIYLYGRV